MRKIAIHILLPVLLLAGLCACSVNGLNNTEDGPINTSGNIEVHQVSIAPEMGGRVNEMLVDEGDTVQAGDVLFTLDDELLRAQRDQAAVAIDLAEISVMMARSQLDGANIQYDLAVQMARVQDQQSRLAAWKVKQPDEITLPVWYFEKREEIAAAQAEVNAAEEDLDIEMANLNDELENASNDDLVSAENRIVEAKATFIIAEQCLDQAKDAKDRKILEDVAQEQFDAAKAELESAQSDYDRLLSSSAYDDLLETRARVAVARARNDNALDHLNSLLTGDQSLQVEAAQSTVHQAETAVAQAEASLTQAQAALHVIEVQLEKTVVAAPEEGIVLSRNLEAGETVAPGSNVLVIGKLDNVTLTVYVSETRYGGIKLGQEARITTDSFPGQVFIGSVVRIADQAEFTPSNVQTIDGRRATVYAVDISIANADHKLKAGMPADVVIEIH